MKNLLGCRSVSKEWQLLSKDLDLLICIIYRDFAFNSTDWSRHFSTVDLKAIYENEDFNTFPKPIASLFENACPIFRQKKWYQTHAIVFLPKGLTLKYFVNLPLLNIIFWEEIIKKYGDIPVEKSSWVVITKYNIPGSPHGRFEEQLNEISKIISSNEMKYRIPKIIEVILCISSTFFKFGERLFCDNYSRCQEVASDDLQICVGTYKSVTHVAFSPNSRGNIGVAAVQTFKV